jgi:hypothetical protein
MAQNWYIQHYFYYTLLKKRSFLSSTHIAANALSIVKIRFSSIKIILADFNLNFAKGFIYLNYDEPRESVIPSNHQIMAHEYLSNAIRINSKSEVCFSLRATLKKRF